MKREPPTTTLFPYTTLFRSRSRSSSRGGRRAGHRALPRPASQARATSLPSVPPRGTWPPSHLPARDPRSEEHTSELQSRLHLVCRLLLEKKQTAINERTEGA